VTHIALGHPHFDHVLGAGAFPEAAVYSAVGFASLHWGTMASGTIYDDAVREGVSPEDAAGSLARMPVPRHEVSGAVTIDLGGREVVLANVGPGHTGHDLALLVPGSPVVVFCGDLVEESGEPQAGPDAVPSQWPASLDRLLALGGEDARYVPGHGAVVDAAFLRTQRSALTRRFGGS
jgi:glyoxylase-like metal-dependent hydrolase (beta-lactamase superfamily II)